MKASWALASAFLGSHPVEGARILDGAGAGTALDILRRCSPEARAWTMSHMDPARAAEILALLPPGEIAKLLPSLPTGMGSRLLRILDPEPRERALAALPSQAARSLRASLKHAEDTAGDLMDPFVVALPAGMSAAQARKHLRTRGRRVHYYVYVIDENHAPVGVINLRDLMLAGARMELSAIMRSPVLYIEAQAGPEAVLSHPAWKTLNALPVIDRQGTLVGTLSHETVARLRMTRDSRGPAGSQGGLMALPELLWVMGAALVDEIANSVRVQRIESPPEEETHGN